jgi:hypothetical protein
MVRVDHGAQANDLGFPESLPGTKVIAARLLYRLTPGPDPLKAVVTDTVVETPSVGPEVETGQVIGAGVLDRGVNGRQPVPLFNEVDCAAPCLAIPDLETYHAARRAWEVCDGLLEVSSAEGVEVCDFG